MDFLTVFSKHFINSHPNLANISFGLIIISVFVGGPWVVYLLLRERISKGRYVFQSKRVNTTDNTNLEHLYLLDTVTGDLFFVEGKMRYFKMYSQDAKKSQ